VAKKHFEIHLAYSNTYFSKEDATYIHSRNCAFSVSCVALTLERTQQPSCNPAQATLHDQGAVRQKVTGANPASYTRVRADDQLFEVGNFIVSPKTPFGSVINLKIAFAMLTTIVCRRLDTGVFYYLRGYVNVLLPGLENSTLTIRTKIKGEEFEKTKKLSEAKIVTLRDDEGVYGGPLRMYGNELVGDVELYHFKGPTLVPFRIEVITRLPDDRVLSSSGAELEMIV
jgi:hypothetical protein